MQTKTLIYIFPISILLAFFHPNIYAQVDNSGICNNAPANIRIGYIPNFRDLDGDNGYTIDGAFMASSTLLKLINPSNFGSGGTVPTTIELIPLSENPISEGYINTLNLDAIFIGATDAGNCELIQTGNTYLSTAETNAIRAWSILAPENLVIVTNLAVKRWDWNVINNNINPDQPTTDGLSTVIFDGPFGTVNSFTQGGCLTLTASGGSGIVLGVDNTGNAVIILDETTNDLIITDVDILTSLGGITNGDGISNSNDILAANLFAYAINLISDCDQDSEVEIVEEGDPCDAGFGAGSGIYDADSNCIGEIIIECPDTTINLIETVVTDNLPNGSTVSFHNASPPNANNQITNPTQAESGVYYLAYYDQVNVTYDLVSTIKVYASVCLQNECPQKTLDLTNLTATNLPNDNILTFHTSTPVTNDNRILDPTSIETAGTYYAAFYDSSNDCYGAEIPIEISIVECCSLVRPGISFSGKE